MFRSVSMIKRKVLGQVCFTKKPGGPCRLRGVPAQKRRKFWRQNYKSGLPKYGTRTKNIAQAWLLFFFQPNLKGLSAKKPQKRRPEQTAVVHSYSWAIARDWVNGERRLSISPLPPPGRKAGRWYLILPVATPFDRVLEGGFHPPGGGRYSIYPWVGRCGPAPHTLTLFKTKIADFPTLFKTEFRFLISCLRHLTRNHTLCKTIINNNFAVF